MKVQDTQEIGGPRPVAQLPSQAAKTAAPQQPAEKPVATDRVSGTVHTLAQTASREAAQSRATRLTEVMNGIRQGTYVPDAQQVANAILDDAEMTARLQAMLSR